MSNPTITATAPSYAPDGARGYSLTVAHGFRVTGWIRTGDDGSTVYATIDGAPWRSVGTVISPSALTPAWVAEHTDAILQPF